MEISIQTDGLSRYGAIEDACRMIRQAGFTGVDWTLYNGWDRKKLHNRQLGPCIFENSLSEIEEHYRRELEAFKSHGLKLVQAHAPFPLYIKDFPEFTDYAIDICRRCARFCAKVGVPYLVVHGISLMIDDYGQTPETIRHMNLRLYESLIPDILDTGMVICLENLFTGYRGHAIEGVCSDADEAVWYIDSLNEKAGQECFGLCLDTGHLNVLGKNPGVYIRKLGTRIKALHIHDNRGVEDEHLAPYAGTIIWRDVMVALKDAGYRGAVNFETFKQIMPESMDPQVIPVWMKMIHDIGEHFLSQLTQMS